MSNTNIMRSIVKKFMPCHFEYWKNRGHSDQESIELANKHKGSRSKGNKNYYLTKGLANSEEDAIRMAKEWSSKKCSLSRQYIIENKFNGSETDYMEWKRENCKLSKKNLLKTLSYDDYITHKRNLGYKLKGKRPSEIQYWMSKGFTETESKKLVIEHGINSSPRRIEYWINRGHSVEESVKNVSAYQKNCSLEKFIERYGDTEGIFRYEQFKNGQAINSIRSYRHWVNMGHSVEDSIKIVSKIQSEYGKLSPKTQRYWMNLGHSSTESLLLAKKFARKLSMWCEEYWMDRGYDYDESKEMVSKIQKENSLKSLNSFNHGGRTMTSNLQESVVQYLVKKNLDIKTDYVINDVECNAVYFPDIVFDGFILEIFGDYWHGNPKMYLGEDIISRGVKCSDKWESDKNRISRIEKITGLPVFIWWESEIIENGIELMFNKLKSEIGI